VLTCAVTPVVLLVFFLVPGKVAEADEAGASQEPWEPRPAWMPADRSP